MQTTQRSIQQPQRDAKKAAAEKTRQTELRTPPRELDLEQLRRVAGGQGPYKTW